MSLHVLGLILLVIAGACFLLAAFGLGATLGVNLTDLGLLFFVGGYAADHHHHGA